MSLLPTREPLDEEFRAVGMTGEARKWPKSERQIRMFAAWNGYPAEKLPDAMKFFANEHMKNAWEAVETAAQYWHNSNPPTIMVALVWIEDGVLTIRRGVKGFGYGKIALPGGFQERGEQWYETLARETEEESGIILSRDANAWHFNGIETVENGTRNLLFGFYNHFEYPVEYTPKLSEETLEIGIWQPIMDDDMVAKDELQVDWAFETHKNYAMRFYADMRD